METIRIEVASDEVGRRLDRFLADRLAVSRARIRHLLEVGRIGAAGRALALSDKSRTTAAGDVFEVAGSVEASEERPIARPDANVVVLAESEGWLVVDKPAGCGVHPLRPEEDETVLNAVVARNPELLGVGEGGLRSGVVHRLDVDTTGALVFAKDESSWRRLRGAFSSHRVHKRYLCLVVGRIEAAQRIEVRLEVTRHRPAHVSVVDSGGRVCRQRITPLRTFEETTLLEVDLETGFLHQIRASLAHLGHPILGDEAYGGTAVLEAGCALEGVAVERPMLHAAQLRIGGIDVSAPLPADFEVVLAALEAREAER